MEKKYTVKHLKRRFDLEAMKRGKVEKEKAIVRQIGDNCVEISVFEKGVISEKGLYKWFLITPQKGHAAPGSVVAIEKAQVNGKKAWKKVLLRQGVSKYFDESGKCVNTRYFHEGNEILLGFVKKETVSREDEAAA